MHKLNTRDIREESWISPKGKFASRHEELSIALGRKPNSTDLKERHPFDVEICRIPAGKTLGPYHSHGVGTRCKKILGPDSRHGLRP